jgi:hypothetical protein
VHVPPWQLELGVQASASSQRVPFCFGLAEQAPLAGLHTPTLQVSSKAEQFTAVPGLHCS